MRVEAFAHGIERRSLHTIVRGEAGDENIGHAAGAQPLSESGRVPPRVVEETAVAVGRGVGSLGEDFRDWSARETRCEVGAASALHAMHWPQDLWQAVQFDALTGLLSGMVRGEALVRRGVPVLCRDNDRKVRGEGIRDRHYRVGVRHGQRAAGQEVILKIDEDQRMHVREAGMSSRNPRPSAIRRARRA